MSDHHKPEAQNIDQRLARMESRIVRIMLHLGLNPREISPRKDDQCKPTTPSTQSKSCG
jgi:hypothetical protein